MNGCDLTPPARTQISERKYSDVMPTNWRPSTSYSCNTPQRFHGKPGLLSQRRQNMRRRLWHILKIPQNFCLQCYDRDKNSTGYQPALVQPFRGIFFQGIWYARFQGG